MNMSVPTGERLGSVRVEDADGAVRVTGASRADVEQALTLWDAVQEETDRARETFAAQVNRAVLRAAEDVLPPATQRQIRREAALRARLLEDEGAETYASLAALRHSTEGAARTLISRKRQQQEVFTVELHGQTLIPRVQLTPRGDVDPRISALARPLMGAGEDSWAVWAWLTSPTGLLSGETPAQVARQDDGAARAERAAQRRAGLSAGRPE